MNEGILRQTSDNLWLFGVLLMLMVLIAVVKTLYASQLTDRTNAVFYNGDFQRYFREQRLQSRLVGYLLSLNFLATISLLGMALADAYFATELESRPQLLLLIFSGLCSYRFLRRLLNGVLKQLFNSDEGLLEYETQTNLNQQITGILLLPIMMLHLFLPAAYNPFNWLLIVACLLVALFIFYSIFRGIRFVFMARLRYVYIILYFCTLEILPFVVLLRMFINQTA
jgi:hypothetical protein